MARKLFALEDLEAQIGETELETTPEEGEVADVQVETAEEVADVVSDGEAVDEGTEAAAQLEEVEAVVEKAAEEEDGLTPAGAEAVKVAVEAICARIGANPKAMHALYATENFASKSSRKANTQYALEGIGEFLKDLWKRIKAALSSLWEKVKAFFEKHVSSLGRVRKALEAMKTKVSESSGKFKGSSQIENPPSSLVEAFAGDTDVSPGVVAKYIAAHNNVSQETIKIEKFTESFKALSSKFTGIINSVDFSKTATVDQVDKAGLELATLMKILTSDEVISFSDKENPLIGGVTWKVTIKGDQTDGTIDIDTDKDTVDSEKDIDVIICDKSALQKLIADTLTVIKDSVKYREKTHKQLEAFNKLSQEISKTVDHVYSGVEKLQDQDVKKEGFKAVKEVRKLVKIFNKISSKFPTMQTEVVTYNIKLAKAVLSYAGLCLKNYK